MNTIKYDTIIWDFNGTILDDIELCRAIINSFLERYTLPQLSLEEYREIFCFPIEAYYAKTGVTAYADFSELALQFNELYRAKVDQLRCFSDVEGAIKALANKGVKQLVISATKQQDLREQMSALGLTEYFDELLGIADYYAAGKAELAWDWLQANRQPNERLLVIGDTDHDYEIAELLMGECWLIARGHMSFRRLQQTGAVVLKDAGNLLELLTNR